MNRFGLLAVFGTVVVASAGCFDALTVESHADLRLPVPSGAVQTAIREDSIAADGSITYVVSVMARDVVVSSYQGSVSFVPGAFDLISVTTPPGQSGEARVFNSSTFGDGRIRFAGLTTTRFAGVDSGNGIEAFRFTVHALRPVSEAKLIASLDVVGTETGTRVTADRVLSSPGVLNATGRLIR